MITTVKIQFGEEAKNIIETLQKISKKGTTITDVFRRSLGIYNFCYNEIIKGHSIVVMKDDTILSEIDFEFDIHKQKN